MLFDNVFKNPKWQGQDDFPSSDTEKNEVNKWLEFIQTKGQLKRYLPRINDKKTLRNEALAEIGSAYYLESKLKYPIAGWEKKTTGGKDVDFIILAGSDEIYCEVKSPGWEGELTQEERIKGRKNLLKYISGDGHFTASWRQIRYALKKSYPKFLSHCKNMVILNDDLFVTIPDLDINISLFDDGTTHGGEEGYFSN